MLGAVLVFHDVTEQRRLSGEMRYRATHDVLTGLLNRGEFEARLLRTLEKAHAEQSEHALMYIDLDQFKLVNDACGHSVGDQLLQQVSKLLTDTLRARDLLARIGGDEFAVILEHCTSAQALRAAQQICDRMDDFRFTHDGRRFRIGASVGLVPVDRRWSTTAALMQAADTSCYAAKEAGRNRVHAWFDTDLAMRARRGEMQWATGLEQALDEGRFVLHAQRIDGLGGDEPGVHAEVLLRMVDTNGELVQPGAFLPAAERFHLSPRIDRWVLRQVIERLMALPDPSPVHTLCVNLSGQSIGDREFHRHAIGLLDQAGEAVRRCLCLEITETAAVTNMGDAALFIDRVHALGVRVALDDFGAGASSFGYLKTLAVDLLKIDGQFIKNLIEDPLDDAMVRCFVDVAKVVGVKTVAEFVDRAETLARVRGIGIDYAQGFLLHEPEAIERVLGGAAAAVPGFSTATVSAEAKNR
jgi:diguanylate cyclase (GGDEF)-like protein